MQKLNSQVYNLEKTPIWVQGDVSKNVHGSIICNNQKLATFRYHLTLVRMTIIKNLQIRTSLVAQWLRTLLPMQGTRDRALVREDPTCRGATKLVCHNYLAPMSQLLKPTHLEPMLRNKRSYRSEKPVHRNED